METVVVAVDEIRAETQLAFLLIIDGDEYWVPKSVIAEADVYEVGDTDYDLEIAEWFCEREGLA